MPHDPDPTSSTRSPSSKSLSPSPNPSPNPPGAISPLHLPELHQSLHSLRSTANATTARLDNTYYSLLSAFHRLKTSLTALQELCTTASTLNTEFLAESGSVTREVQEQLATLEDLDEQKKTLEGLQKRIEVGREKVVKLQERVDGVRGRAERWKRGERGWEEKTRRRIRLFWGLIVLVLVAVVGLLVFQYIPARQPGVGGGKQLSVEEVLADLEALGQKSGGETGREGRVLEGLWKGIEGREEDERLRVFDEL